MGLNLTLLPCSPRQGDDWYVSSVLDIDRYTAFYDLLRTLPSELAKPLIVARYSDTTFSGNKYYDRLTKSSYGALRYVTLADFLSLYDNDIVKRSVDVRGAMDYLRHKGETIIVLYWNH